MANEIQASNAPSNQGRKEGKGAQFSGVESLWVSQSVNCTVFFAICGKMRGSTKRLRGLAK